MRNQMKALTLLVSALLAGGPAIAADDVAVTKDLTSVIALMGMPCGQVVSAQRQAENDYLATCKDGNRYRVYTNAQGRVVAEKR
jgi:hypothetical protein